MSATTKEKRERRVMRRSIPEVVAAISSGKLSIRLGDDLLRLSRPKQKVALEHRLRAQDEAERRSRVAAETIRQYLDSCDNVNLEDLRRRIRAAIA
jgi:hypothetical protein